MLLSQLPARLGIGARPGIPQCERKRTAGHAGARGYRRFDVSALSDVMVGQRVAGCVHQRKNGTSGGRRSYCRLRDRDRGLRVRKHFCERVRGFMGTLSLNVHSTKLLYATILEGISIWRKVNVRRDLLSGMLPDIGSQWAILKTVLMPCISRKVAVTASLSKSETVPDETRVPPSIEINGGTVKLMKGLADSLGLTLNTDDYEWYDSASGFRQAIENFSVVAVVFLEIEQLVMDLCMHRSYAADLYSDQDENRTPGQLAYYIECDAPLADGVFVNLFNRMGMLSGFGSHYLGWLMSSVEQLVATDAPDFEQTKIDVVATPEDDPEDPGANTLYRFQATSGWALAGAIVAASPNVSAPSTFFDHVTYDSATSGYLSVGGDYSDPTYAAVGFKLLLLRAA